jgi:hypothetical protein
MRGREERDLAEHTRDRGCDEITDAYGATVVTAARAAELAARTLAHAEGALLKNAAQKAAQRRLSERKW